MEIVVEVRRCHGCGNKMKVMPSSKQTHCMKRCLETNLSKWLDRNGSDQKNTSASKEIVTVRDTITIPPSVKGKPSFAMFEWPLRRKKSAKEPEADEDTKAKDENTTEKESEGGSVRTETESTSIVEATIEPELVSESESKSLTVDGEEIRSMDSRARSGNLSEEISRSMSIYNSSIDHLHGLMKSVVTKSSLENEVRLIDLERAIAAGALGKQVLDGLKGKLELMKFKKEMVNEQRSKKANRETSVRASRKHS